LLANAAILRNVHLIDCCIAEVSEAKVVECIELTLRPALALTAVEIYYLKYGEQPSRKYIIAVGEAGAAVDEEDLEEDEEQTTDQHERDGLELSESRSAWQDLRKLKSA
jgi:hypothetical protein